MPNRNHLKLLIAWGLSALQLDRVLLALQRQRLRGRFIRLVNYHGTPAKDARNFEKHLRFYQRHFVPVHLHDLERLVSGQPWDKDRPGLLLSFDDGLRTNYDVAVPLLERYGFVGWFFIPTGFIDTPPGEQERFAEAHAIDARRDSYPDGRIAMSWDELRQLDRKHVIGCHTQTHWRLAASSSAERLDQEIVVAKKVLQEQLGHAVDLFCWVGGEEQSYSAAAAARLHEAGYRYAFLSCSAPAVAGTDRFRLHRSHVEADWPLALVRFQISGIADWFNAAKRRRVDRLVTREA